MEFFSTLLGHVNDFLYTYFLVAVLIIVGLYFSFRTNFVQFRLLKDAIKLTAEKKDGSDSVSSFQALMISTASRVGTGNIAGVATAIATGGPGAVFWMWLIALLGAASAFVESTLAQIYKEKHGDEYRGGPAYYIQKGLGSKKIGILFSIFLIMTFGYGFNALQANNIVSAFSVYFGGEFPNKIIPIVIGLILAALSAYGIFGGLQRIGFISSIIVPIMAGLYMLLGFFIFFKNITIFPSVVVMIFKSAFDFQSMMGGLAGSALVYGIKRGLFSNEAGMGSAPNAAATANVSHPAKQGLVQLLSVFIDTLLICTTTAFIILLSGTDIKGAKALPLVQSALQSQIGHFGVIFITISVFFFAFSSIVGNYCYAESNVLFIKDDKKNLKWFRWSVVVTVFLGSIAGYDLVWDIADVVMALMATVNIFSILLLGNNAIKALDDYTKQKKAGKNPTFSPEELGIKNADYWTEN